MASWDNFDPTLVGQVLSLQNKLQKHVQESGSVSKLQAYMLITLKAWPEVSLCPIDKNLLNCCVQKLKANGKWFFPN